MAELRDEVPAAGREGSQIRSVDRPADAGGADWSPEIEAKARACDIFVLLVSANSTGSDYIVDKEIPIVRERQRNGDGVWFYPLLLDWTPKAGLEQVNDKNLRPRDAKPFLSLPPSERSRAMAEAADEIAEVAKAVEERKTAVAEQSQPVSSPLQGLGSLLGPAITNFIVGGYRADRARSGRAASGVNSRYLRPAGNRIRAVDRARRRACAPR